MGLVQLHLMMRARLDDYLPNVDAISDDEASESTIYA